MMPSDREKPERMETARPPVSEEGASVPPVDSARLGMVLFLAAETMFFAGLIGAFLVFRIGAPAWPPDGQPRPSPALPGLLTALLAASAVTMQRAFRRIRQDNRMAACRWLVATLLLGGAFLAGQTLIENRPDRAAGSYGFTVHTLVDMHALHLAGGVVWVLIGAYHTYRGRYGADRHTGLALCRMYWYFVMGLWLALYGLVYVY
jgi:cytochrome c oxidase subunit 3